MLRPCVACGVGCFWFPPVFFAKAHQTGSRAPALRCFARRRWFVSGLGRGGGGPQGGREGGREGGRVRLCAAVCGLNVLDVPAHQLPLGDPPIAATALDDAPPAGPAGIPWAPPPPPRTPIQQNCGPPDDPPPHSLRAR